MNPKNFFKKSRKFYLLALLALVLTVPLALSGCGGGGGGGSSSPTSSTISGTADGGLSHINGATVTLYAAGSSSSLGTATTSSNGSFTITYTPPSSNTLLYVKVSGGNAGSGTNTQIDLKAAVGPSNSSNTSVTVNEFTTVAYAAFESNPSLALGAYSNYYEKYVTSSGQPSSSAPNETNLQNMELLANAAASCVQSSTNSTNCSDLTADVGATGTSPTTYTMITDGITNGNSGSLSTSDVSGINTLARSVYSTTGWTNIPSSPSSMPIANSDSIVSGVYSGTAPAGVIVPTFTLIVNPDSKFSYSDTMGDTASGTYSLSGTSITISNGTLCTPSSTGTCQNGGGTDHTIPGTFKVGSYTIVFPSTWTVNLNSNGMPASISGTITVNGTSETVTLNAQTSTPTVTLSKGSSDVAGMTFTNNFSPALTGTPSNGYMPITYGGNTIYMPYVPYTAMQINGTFGSSYNSDGSIGFSGSAATGSNVTPAYSISISGSINSYSSPYYGEFDSTDVYTSSTGIFCSGSTLASSVTVTYSGTTFIFTSGGYNYLVYYIEPTGVSNVSPSGASCTVSDFNSTGGLFQLG